MSKSKLIRIILYSVGLAAVLAFVILRWLFLGYYQIPQDGMYPTLPKGSRLFCLKTAYRHPSDVRRGDIIVFNHTDDEQQRVYVWRVIGLPGDKVSVDGEEVLVNGAALRREEVRVEGNLRIYREFNGDASYEVAYDLNMWRRKLPKGSVKLKPGDIFVLGDNRCDAKDSRYFGAVPFSSIIGRKL